MLSLVKRGGSFGTTGLRTILLRNQGTSVYDIWLVRHTIFTTNLGNANEGILAALSQRLEDQIEDTTSISQLDILSDAGIFNCFSWIEDLETSGMAAMVGNQVTGYNPKPMTVPFLSWLVSPLNSNVAGLGVEVFFERKEVTALEKATLVRIVSGGRTRPSG